MLRCGARSAVSGPGTRATQAEFPDTKQSSWNQCRVNILIPVVPAFLLGVRHKRAEPESWSMSGPARQPVSASLLAFTSWCPNPCPAPGPGVAQVPGQYPHPGSRAGASILAIPLEKFSCAVPDALQLARPKGLAKGDWSGRCRSRASRMSKGRHKLRGWPNLSRGMARTLHTLYAKGRRPGSS